MTDMGRKLILQVMIERVHLFPERLDNGRYVKGVTFKFPVMLEGEMTDHWWYKRSPVETVCCLCHRKEDFISVPYEPKDVDYLKQDIEY